MGLIRLPCLVMMTNHRLGLTVTRAKDGLRLRYLFFLSSNKRLLEDMTDKEKLIGLLNDFGIGFDIEDDDRYGGIERVNCKKGMAHVGGYDGHSFSWYFDENGKFTQVNAWV